VAETSHASDRLKERLEEFANSTLFPCRKRNSITERCWSCHETWMRWWKACWEPSGRST